MRNRKPVAVMGDLVILDDGSVYRWVTSSDEYVAWEQQPPIPGTQHYMDMLLSGVKE